MVYAVKHIVRNSITPKQVFLENSLIGRLFDLLQEEAFMIVVIFFPTQASLEYVGYGQVFYQVVSDSHRLPLVPCISFLMTTNNVSFRIKREMDQKVMSSMRYAI